MPPHQPPSRPTRPADREITYLKVHLNNGESVEAPLQTWVSCLIQLLPAEQFEELLRTVQAANRSLGIQLPFGATSFGGR